MNANLEHFLALTGAAVPLISAIASLFNTVIRNRQLEGKPVSKGLATVGAVLNAMAVNLDKAAMLIGVVRGKPVVSGSNASKPQT
jgi:hypothetical protein